MSAVLTTPSTSLLPLMTALDHLETSPGLQPLADRVMNVCRDQGLAVTRQQALEAATQALATPVPNQTAKIEAYLAQRPATRTAYEAEVREAANQIKKGQRARMSVLAVLGVFPTVMAVIDKGFFGHLAFVNWSDVLSFTLLLGCMASVMGLGLGVEIAAELKQELQRLKAGDPTWGQDSQGRHWSHSAQALCVYHRLMATDVPLLMQDVYFLNGVAQTEWQAQANQGIHARLRGARS
jgi:hypothetical protein